MLRDVEKSLCYVVLVLVRLLRSKSAERVIVWHLSLARVTM